MKRRTRRIFPFLCAMLIVLVNIACEKVSFDKPQHTDTPEQPGDNDDNDDDDADKTCGIDVQVTPFVITRSVEYPPSSDKITFAVFDSNRKRVGMALQRRDEMEDFGHWHHDFKPGKYSLIIIAHHTIKDVEITTPDSVCFANEFVMETYSKKIDFELKEGETQLMPVTLDCITTKLKMQFVDSMPMDARSIKVIVPKGDFFFNPSTGFAISNHPEALFFAVPDSVRGKAGHTIYINRFLMQKTDVIDLTATIINFEGDEVKSYQLNGIQAEIGKTKEIEVK